MTEARLIEENQQWETHWEFMRAWLKEVADGHINGNDVLKVMDELRPDLNKPRLFRAEKDLKRIASVLSDYGGIRTLFSMKEEDLNFEEKALARIYEILQGVDEQ